MLDDDVFYGSVYEYIRDALRHNLSIRVYDEHSNIVHTILSDDGSSCSIINGEPYPIISNMVYSRNVIAKLLGAANDVELYMKINSVYNATVKPNVKYMEFEKFFEKVDRNPIPLLKFYEEQSPRYFAGIVVSCINELCNASIHRIMVLDENYYCIRVVPRHLYRIIKTLGKPPAAIIIGVHPLVELVAATSPPFGVYEIPLAAGIVGKHIALCRTPIYNIPVPCGASIVIEGILNVDKCDEEPYVDILELIDYKMRQPAFSVKAIYINKVFKPFLRIIVPGSVEHKVLMGLPREAQIYELASRVANIKKVRLLPQSGMWLIAVISLKKEREGEQISASLAAFTAHPSLKMVIVVDEDIDPDNIDQVLWAIATRVKPKHDVIVIDKAVGSTLDPSAEAGGLTSKLIIDATIPLNEDERKYRRCRRVHVPH